MSKKTKPSRLTIDCASFTTVSALAREIVAWLEFSDCKLTVKLHSEREHEELSNELENCRTLGRAKLEFESTSETV